MHIKFRSLVFRKSLLTLSILTIEESIDVHYDSKPQVYFATFTTRVPMAFFSLACMASCSSSRQHITWRGWSGTRRQRSVVPHTGSFPTCRPSHLLSRLDAQPRSRGRSRRTRQGRTQASSCSGTSSASDMAAASRRAARLTCCDGWVSRADRTSRTSDKCRNLQTPPPSSIHHLYKQVTWLGGIQGRIDVGRIGHTGPMAFSNSSGLEHV